MKNSESGFTLIEAMIATVILVFGLIAVTNLMVVAGTSNTVANQSTAAAVQASGVMERLKAIPFTDLVVGGNLTADAGATLNCQDEPPTNCVVANNFNAERALRGVGQIKTRWQIVQGTVVGPDPQVLFIRVRSEGTGALTRVRSRAEFTVFRSCTSTDVGCPAAP